MGQCVCGGYLKGLNGDLMRRDEFARRETEIGLGVPEGQEDRKSSGHTVGVELLFFFSHLEITWGRATGLPSQSLGPGLPV